MGKTRRNNKKNKKRKTYKHYLRKLFIAKNTTPYQVRQLSDKISKKSSYSPTINRELVTLKSIDYINLMDCNSNKAFKLKEPLQIGVKGKCYYYYKPEAVKFMLRNLKANKHIDPTKIIPPIQLQSNCWFNSMFVTFFVSDKGRKFFHFLRQLMIEGKQQDGTVIPESLRDAFALLNFGVDACLTGNEFAYKLDTNSIIHSIFKAIPSSYKKQFPFIVDIDEAGNPLLYYVGIINYLHNSSIQLLLIRDVKNSGWKDEVSKYVHQMGHIPHIIVLEIYDEEASVFNKKPISFSILDAKYEIDSSVVRDISKQHFCSVLTCEGQEMGYDGASFKRLVNLKWKDKMNTNMDWEFEGTEDYDGRVLKWNFTKCYQLLMYYRVK